MKANPGTHNHIYSCPMHPEITGKVGATCPKCGMKLQMVSKPQAVHNQEYFMDFVSDPLVLEAGKGAKLTFIPKIRGKKGFPVALDVLHEKKIHLIIVNEDLSYFDHVHPEYQPDGSYVIKVQSSDEHLSINEARSETKFEQGGNYVLFVDYKPKGAPPKLERIPLVFRGDSKKTSQQNTPRTVSITDGFEVSLVPDGGRLLSEGMSQISVVILKDGKEIPPHQLENYLGAKAHVVVISHDSMDFIHVHPEVVEGRLSLHTSFGRPGVFRAWLQFQIKGTIHTADFVLQVDEGKVLEKAHGMADGHRH